MKVSLHSVIKTSETHFECFEDQQIIFRAGNTLCIRELGKAESEFIPLSRHIDRLYAFRATNSRKGAFTAERNGKEIELAMYGLTGDRRAIPVPLESTFASEV